MANSLFTGVTGLRVNQQMLDVVGNNLANGNTTGYKSQSVGFEDVLYQTLAPATASSGTTSGTNPLQAGFGVKVAAIDTTITQGSLQSTGKDLDVALQGNGFFVVNDGSHNLFTRAGSFNIDSQNFLVDPTTGFRVQRFGTVGEGSATSPAFQVTGDSSIRIPQGTALPGQTTKSVTLLGNLSANAIGPLAEVLTTGLPLQAVGGTPATATTLLNNLNDNTIKYVAGDQLRLQGSTVNGTAVNTTLAVGPATTVGDLINAINGAFAGSAATLDANGNIVVRANTTGPASLNLAISDVTGNTGATQWSSHALTVLTAGKNGDTVPTAIQVFDSQGTAHNLSLVFQKQTTNSWNLTGSIPASDGTMTQSVVQGITFNDDGSFRQVTGNPTMTMQFAGIAAPQTISLSYGIASGFNGLTQFGGNSSAASTSQDGFASGTLASVSISKEGIISGIFTNGRTLTLAQMGVALFSNPAGLNREGQNLFSLSSQSGQASIGSGNTGGRGTVQSGALEGSNVDVSLEFTRLIVAQRAFEVNAKVITVSDQVLQTLSSIIR